MVMAIDHSQVSLFKVEKQKSTHNCAIEEKELPPNMTRPCYGDVGIEFKFAYCTQTLKVDERNCQIVISTIVSYCAVSF